MLMNAAHMFLMKSIGFLNGTGTAIINITELRWSHRHGQSRNLLPKRCRVVACRSENDILGPTKNHSGSPLLIIVLLRNNTIELLVVLTLLSTRVQFSHSFHRNPPDRNHSNAHSQNSPEITDI